MRQYVLHPQFRAARLNSMQQSSDAVTFYIQDLVANSLCMCITSVKVMGSGRIQATRIARISDFRRHALFECQLCVVKRFPILFFVRHTFIECNLKILCRRYSSRMWCYPLGVGKIILPRCFMFPRCMEFMFPRCIGHHITWTGADPS